MDTPANRCARILAALEDLADREAAALRTRDFAAVREIQDRAAPLVDDLVQHAATVENDRAAGGLRARLHAVHGRRARSSEWLEKEIKQGRDDLREAQAGCRRVAQIAPVYGRTAAAPRQLRAIG